MKKLSERSKEQKFINESRYICEFFGLKNLMAWIRKIFMPWTDDAQKMYSKIFMESSVRESSGSRDLKNTVEEGGMTLRLYKLDDASWKTLGRNVVGQKPLIVDVEGASVKSADRYIIDVSASGSPVLFCIVLVNPENGHTQCLVVPDKDSAKEQVRDFLNDKKNVDAFKNNISKLLK